MTDPTDRTISWMRSTWTDLLQRLLGRYYAPEYESMIALIGSAGLLGVYGTVRGYDGYQELLIGVLFVAGLVAWMIYRHEQRWSA